MSDEFAALEGEALFFAQMLAEYRQKFEDGDYRQAILAMSLCAWNKIPVPDWLHQETHRALLFTFKNGGAAGRGKSGGYAKRLVRETNHRMRHQIADHELDRRRVVGGTRADAFERASERLRGTPARGSSTEIERSYNKIQRALRAKNAPTRCAT
jgi:hypothetical protein